MAVRANHTLGTGSGRTMTAARAAAMIPAHAWHRMRTGSGTKGVRHYDWAVLEVPSDDTPAGPDLATPPPEPGPASPPTLECLRRDCSMITTNYSRRNCGRSLCRSASASASFG
jgi:hypothetical protein